jgi:hypothetical protein
MALIARCTLEDSLSSVGGGVRTAERGCRGGGVISFPISSCCIAGRCERRYDAAKERSCSYEDAKVEPSRVPTSYQGYRRQLNHVLTWLSGAATDLFAIASRQISQNARFALPNLTLPPVPRSTR